MSSDKDFNKLLEKIYNKLENFNSFEEADLFEIKNKIREIGTAISSSKADENFDRLSSQLNDIEEKNTSLKDTISDLITTSSNMIEKLSTTDENSIIKLQTFLTELAYQVSSIKDEIELSKDIAQKSLLDGFNGLADSLKDFQEDLAERVKNDFEGANLAFSKIVEELTEKLTELEVQFNNYNTTLTNELVISINEIQSDTTNINQHLENITNLQNLALTNAEYEEHQKELELSHEESLSKIKDELSELHEKLSLEIIEILNKISIGEEVELVKSALDDNSDAITQEISNVKDYIKDFQDSTIEQTSSTIKEIKTQLEKYENFDLTDSVEKIDIIYENITIINNWVSKIDNIKENVVNLSGKVDIIQDNTAILNEWASKLDKINNQIDSLNTKIDESNEITEDEEDTANKIDIIYENLSLLNNWILKIDGITEKVHLFDEISNKVDEVNDNVSNISTWGFKIEDIKDKLEELSNEFAIITSATKDDTENYIYTLLDIESDFTKLHYLLDNGSKTTDEDLQTIKNQFDILNDDISSISKRTNKLILTSDDANKVFKNHIDRFQYLIEDLNNKAVAFNPVKQFTLLENKTNTIKKLVASNLTSSQNLNEAFVLLAEWVDVTGETITSIKDGMDNLQAQVENVQLQNAELQNDSPKKDINQIKVQINEVSTKLDSVSQEKTELMGNIVAEVANKFKEQQYTISSLETKIDTLENTVNSFDTKFEALENKFKTFDKRFNSIDERFDLLDAKLEGINKTEDTSEVKTVLDFIASQVISANENSINNKVLNQKMEIMEHQLSKFEKNIAKLVSYLDED